MNILTQQNYLEKNLINSEFKNSLGLSLAEAPLIDIAALELTSVSLSKKLIDFAYKAHQQGIKQIKVIPLFLAPGVHVQLDIPAEITSAVKETNNLVKIELSSYLGKYSGIATLIARMLAEIPAETKILVAHGSKRTAGVSYYQSLAKKLTKKLNNVELAYWAVEPKITPQIKAQIALGAKKIAILPYFLFPGRITQAIAQEIAELQQDYPEVELILGQPLGTTEALVELMIEEA